MNALTSPSTPKVLIFGSQALGFDKHAAEHLRTALLQTPECAWLLDSLAELRKYWTAAAPEIQALQEFPGGEYLEDLSTWLRTGSFANCTFPLPNTILTPLVVVSHLAQYLQFLGLAQQKEDRLSASFLRTTESMGLCTGLLAATAAACSSTRADLQQYGTVAVRLAMLIGSIVDAQNQASGGNQSFTIAWSSAALGEKAREIIQRDPDAYISVIIDENKVTVTTSARAASALQQELKTAGIIVAEISLDGRFHTKDHVAALQALHAFCDSHPELQFPDVKQLIFPTRSNTDDGALIRSGPLHRTITQSMLTEQCQWFRAFQQLDASTLQSENAVVVVFGAENSAPGWLARKLGLRLVMLDQLGLLEVPISRASLLDPQAPVPYRQSLSRRGIAVVGMSATFAGAPDLDQLWQVLSSGKSQHIEVPPERFTIETPWREKDPKRKWYGNFIDGYDTFDHKFFKKSPREMASTDPQHRLMLQAAYQAVEQSGYFNQTSPSKEIGCYIGVGLVDYERNIACAPANAYSATGNLKSFAAGKISHYFGWTGPGLTVDTACSSSAVAINLACQAILSGQVKGALAGGVNIMTSPEWFQNLAGASFLSPTGQCKPFDERGDGYCRGEGVGAVFLKPIELALADGDQILGIIAASNVYQNENCTPITVPNAPSLSDLFRDTIDHAGLQPQHISYVEAHGTGTPVGDPAEYDGIRSVVGGKRRHDTLALGSVKGAIGHTESASGIAALLKTLLMLNKGAIPPQASFQTLSPGINASPSDRIEIPTSLRPWRQDFRAALINNYGASGSNACMVVTQGPRSRPAQQAEAEGKRPFWLTGLGEDSLQRYAAALREYLQRHPEVSLSSLSFQVAQQSNRQLPRALIFGCSSVAEMMDRLARFEKGDTSGAKTHGDAQRPVVMCFGGQVSTFVGLPRQLYEQVTVFRHWLDEYDAVCQSLGLESIFPEIFERSPVQDTVKLQTMLFGAQYACARSWIDCGIRPAALVGFSFGELTALCVSGILSLRDAVKAVAGRARLIQEKWGADKGAMMAVEGPRESVEALLRATAEVSDGSASIACFNGPTSFTLAGTAAAIDAAAQKAQASGIRHKKLNVTNAFHSCLVEPLRSDLEQLGEEVDFRSAVIPLEHATEDDRCGQPLGHSFFADHLRNPVHFHNAAKRLAQKYPNAIWLEAGFNSTIANIAQRALEALKSCHFQPLNLDSGIQGLTDSTLRLWEEDVNVRYWPHHAIQASMYDTLLLPPYQFEKSRHWMELRPIPSVAAAAQPPVQSSLPPKTMWTFLGYQDSQQCVARFQINTTNEEFHNYVSSHIIAQTAPLCPSTLQLSIAIDALMSLYGSSKVQPEARDLVNHAPMSLSPATAVWLEAQRTDARSGLWRWKLSSTSATSPEEKPTVHATGDVIFRPAAEDPLSEELERYQHLIGQARCQALLHSPSADEVLTGTKIYRRFSEIVEYGPMYRGLQKLVGKDHESAGRVVHTRPGTAPTPWLDPGLADSFCQVAGIFINVMTDECSSAEVYISNRIDRWFRSSQAPADGSEWEVFATHRRPAAKRFLSDVFVFEPKTGRLAEAILGIHYQLVPKAALRSILGKPGPGPAVSTMHAPNGVAPIETQPVQLHAPVPEKLIDPHPSAKPAPKKPSIDIAGKVREIIANVSGIEADEIRDESDLNELGIDSLMGMELAREIEGAFSCSFEADQLLNVTHFHHLVSLVATVLGVGEEDGAQDEEATTAPVKTESLNGVNGQSNGVLATNGVTNGVSNGVTNGVNGVNGVASVASLSASMVVDTFAECKAQTDRFIYDCRFGGYADQILPKSNEMCAALIADAFEQLGCPLRTAQPGEALSRITALPRHRQFVDWIYTFLERDAKLIEVDEDRILRSAVSAPQKTARELLDELVASNPDHVYDHELTYMTGVRLADCLTGKADALQLIFGNPEGREVVSNMYGKSPINQVWVMQMQAFLTSLLSRLDRSSGTLNILELGAGTGGTTAKLLPLLSSLGVPVQYTVTDLSASLVAAARKRFKEYPWVRTQVLDIEKPAPAELQHTQHIIIATNCVHATHSLTTSTGNIRQLLRPDGFLMMLEMTQLVPWVDLVFGLIEGWWLFNDGRTHALSPPETWERALHSVGYGHVDWTDGHLPEAAIQRIIIALAEGTRYARSSITPVPPVTSADLAQREAAIEHYVHQHTHGFAVPLRHDDWEIVPSKGRVILVTGATGSLGSHLVAHLSSRPDVRAVFCANRRCSGIEAEARQMQMLSSRGIALDAASQRKLRVLEVDTSKAWLGLSEAEYSNLAAQVTDIVHNAWPMSITRGIQGFTAQFQAMRNLIDLACHAYSRHHQQVGFQFVSSIATVGHQPLWTKSPLVLEKPVGVESVLPTGYGDAKLVCERMLDRTLGQAPRHFRPMSVRIGQISGSTASGYWNPVEHFAFLIKSSQTIQALPRLHGTLSWCPVTDVAATLGDLLLSSAPCPYPIYQIENPSRQPWDEMLATLADALGIDASRVIPFAEWVERVRQFGNETENPALRIIGFLENNFERMSCGGLVLDTRLSREHSSTLRNRGPVSMELVRKYIRAWQEMGFLH